VVVAKTSVEASRNLASFVQVPWPTGKTRPLFGSICQIRAGSVAAAQPVFVPAISASWPPRSRTLVKWRYFHTLVTVANGKNPPDKIAKGHQRGEGAVLRSSRLYPFRHSHFSRHLTAIRPPKSCVGGHSRPHIMPVMGGGILMAWTVRRA
jgi:hypothetical protein